MPNYRYPKITLEGWILGQRPRGRPPKRWIDNIKSSCQEIGIASVCEAIRLIDDKRLVDFTGETAAISKDSHRTQGRTVLRPSKSK